MSIDSEASYRAQFSGALWLTLVFFAVSSASAILMVGAVASAATPGFVEEFDFDNGGFDFGVPATRIATGGITGSGDPYLEISRATLGNLVSRCSADTAPELVGNLPLDGVTGFSFFLRDTGVQQTALRIRVFLGVVNVNLWTSNAEFDPTTSWTEFSVDTTNAGNWTQIRGSGSFADAVANMELIGFRHDPAPIAVGVNPEMIIGDFGVDGLEVLPEPDAIALTLTAVGCLAALRSGRRIRG